MTATPVDEMKLHLFTDHGGDLKRHFAERIIAGEAAMRDAMTSVEQLDEGLAAASLSS